MGLRTMYICMFVCMYVCMACMYVCMHLCKYLYVYMFVSTYNKNSVHYLYSLNTVEERQFFQRKHEIDF